MIGYRHDNNLSYHVFDVHSDNDRHDNNLSYI